MLLRVAVALLILTAIPARAEFTDGDTGASGAQFLRLGAGARAEALAGAYGAVGGDVNALYWNPAGLAHLNARCATFMHAPYVQSVFYDFAAVGMPVGERGGLGAGVQYLSAGNINETDELGFQTGVYRPENVALSAGGAWRWGTLSIGSSIKYVRVKVRDSASTATADLGLQYRMGLLTLGAAAQNLFGYVTYEREASRLPLNLGFSAALNVVGRVLVTGAVNAPRDGRPDVSVGLEHAFEPVEGWLITPRAGYTTRVQDLSGQRGVTAGLGFGTSRMSVDYAWVPLGDLGQTHRVSVTFLWGDIREGADESRRATKEVEEFERAPTQPAESAPVQPKAQTKTQPTPKPESKPAASKKSVSFSKDDFKTIPAKPVPQKRKRSSR